MNKVKKIILFLLMLVANFALKAQVKVVMLDSNQHVLRRFKVSDSAEAKRLIALSLQKLKDKGYAAASVDSVRWSGKNSLKVYLFKGPIFLIDSVVLLSNGAEQAYRYAKPLNVRSITQILRETRSTFQNQGYATCRVAIDSMLFTKITPKTVRLKVLVNVQKGRFFVFDTLFLPETTRISKKFLAGYLGIKVMKPYSKAAVSKIPQKLQQIPEIKLTDEVKEEFYKRSVRVILPIKITSPNAIDALVGLKYQDKRIQSVGKVYIKTFNLLNNAEKLTLAWEKSKENWQQLDLRLAVPYIWGLPTGLSAAFFVQKVDTLDLNLRLQASLDYYFFQMDKISLGLAQEKNLTNRQYAQDVTKNWLAFGLTLNHLDDVYWPTKGFNLRLAINFGQKKFKNSSQITQSYSLNAQYFAKLCNCFTVRLATEGYSIHSPQIFDNEVIYLGGMPQLPGFDPKQLKATNYIVLSVWPQLIATNKLKFLIVTSAARINLKTTNISQQNKTLSAGLGFRLKSKNSILSIIYATAKLNDQPWLLKNAKIHLSYKVLF